MYISVTTKDQLQGQQTESVNFTEAIETKLHQIMLLLKVADMKRTKYFRGRKFGMWNSIRISVQTILDKLFGIKIKVQKLKTDDGQDLEDITTWNEKFENDIGQHEDLIDSSVIKIKEQKHHRKVTIKEEKEEERLKRVSEE